MIKRLTMWHARRGVSRDQAIRHWLSSHVPLVMAVPGVRRYTQNCCLQQPDGSEPPYAGLGELWFDSMETAVAAQTTPQWRAVIDDAAIFMDLDQLTISWAEEHTVP